MKKFSGYAVDRTHIIYHTQCCHSLKLVDNCMKNDPPPLPQIFFEDFWIYADRHVALLRHIILIPSQPVFALSP
jgi:hypothetical protein